jgi:hypothetical protein
MFYVYAHYKADDPIGNPFYIGKGKGPRELSHNRNPFWQNIVKKHGFISKRLYENLTEQEAWDIEIKLINQYGKLTEGSGCLCNLANGGEGASGVKHTDVTKEKWSRAKKGKTWEEIYGLEKAAEIRAKRKLKKRVQSEETKRKMSKSKQGEKNPMYGKSPNPEHSAKLSAAKIGKSSNNKGKTASAESRQNYKKAAILRATRTDIYEKVSSKLTGIKRSEETRKKMSEAAKARELLKKLNKGINHGTKNI